MFFLIFLLTPALDLELSLIVRTKYLKSCKFFKQNPFYGMFNFYQSGH